MLEKDSILALLQIYFCYKISFLLANPPTFLNGFLIMISFPESVWNSGVKNQEKSVNNVNVFCSHSGSHTIANCARPTLRTQFSLSWFCQSDSLNSSNWNDWSNAVSSSKMGAKFCNLFPLLEIWIMNIEVETLSSNM